MLISNMQTSILFLKESDNDSYSSCHALIVNIITAVISIRRRIVMRPAKELSKSFQSFANPSIHTSVVTNTRLLILVFWLVRMTAQTFT